MERPVVIGVDWGGGGAIDWLVVGGGGAIDWLVVGGCGAIGWLVVGVD